MPLPHWLFKKAQTTAQSSSSTMAGTFSTRNLLKGENPFAAQIPSQANPEPEKKRVIITDFSLPFEEGERLMPLFECIDTLMHAGFKVYLFKARSEDTGTLIQLSTDPRECNLRAQIQSLYPFTADNALEYDPDYTADGTVLVDYLKMRELVAAMKGFDLDFTIYQNLNSKQFVDRLQTLVIPFFQQYRISLEGHALPELILDKHVLNSLDHQTQELTLEDPLLSELGNCLHWGFRFIIYDVETLERCLADETFPKDRITGFHIQSEEEFTAFKNLNIQLPNVKRLWFFDVGSRIVDDLYRFFPNIVDVGAAEPVVPHSPGVTQSSSHDHSQTTSEEGPEETPLVHQLTVPNKVMALKLYTEYYAEAMAIYLSQVPNEVNQERLDQIRSDMEAHSNVIYFEGSFVSLTTYLQLAGGAHLKTVRMTYSETTVLPDFMNSENLVSKLILSLNAIPSEDDIERIMSYFGYLKELQIDISVGLIMTNPNRYFEALAQISRVLNAEPAPDSYKASLPVIQAVYRMMKELYLLLDDEAESDLRSQITEFLDTRIRYPVGEDEDETPVQNNDIYDGANVSGPRLSLHQTQMTSTFNMVKVCEILEGGSSYPNIRRRKFYYNFAHGSQRNPVKQYVAPVFADRLPDNAHFNPTHKLYSNGGFVWNEQYQCYCHQFPGLTKFDIVCDWRLLRGSGDFELRYSTSDNFYYMTSKTDPGPGIEFSFRIHAPQRIDTNRYASEAAPYRKNFKTEDRPNPVYSLENVAVNAEYYNCAQRTAGFLFQHRTHSAQFYGVESRTHEWIEHETGVIDLGGRPSNLVHQQRPRPAARVSDDYIPLQKPKPLNTPREVQEILNTEGTNTLLLFETKEALEKMREMIIAVTRDRVIPIDNPSDLKTSVPYLSVANNSLGMGPLPGGWIVNQLQSPLYNLLLIDWTNFIGRDLPQNNTCIGKITQRKIEGFPLDPKFHVLGLALKDSPAAHDRSHVSRHKGNVFYVNNSAFPVWNHEAVQHENVLTIDLHGSPQWFEILLGRIEIEEGVFKGYYGKLFPQDYTKLVIKNPPRECQEFERFINHAYYGTYFQYFDQSFRFHQAVDVEIVYGNDFEAYAGLIGRIHENVVDVKLSDHRIDQVVTPSTFERLLHDTYIDEKGILRKSPGWIELGDRYFYLTRTLLNHQLCALLDHLLEIPGPVQKLHLYCAPGVVIPAELKQHVTCTQDDLDLTSDEFEEGDQRDGMPVDLMIDVSGRSPDDLLYGNKVTQTPSHFLFNEEQSDVWKALLHGKHVLLKGHFSVELIDHLSTLLLPNPYLWHRHQKAFVTGRLTLCPEKPTPALSWIKSDNRIVGIARSPDNPISLVLNPHQDRKLSLDVIFSFSTHQPAVLIQGAPGIGKSCFIRELINDHSDEYKIYSEKRIVEWAMDKRFRGKISALVIDESTIRGTDWSIFEGLYANPPHVLIKNKVYFLQPHQRVIFLGNQTPTMPSLFRRVAKMTFGPMTRDSVIEKILRPVLAEQAESFYAARPNLSVRELHAQAIAEAAKRNLMHSRFSHSFGQFDLTASRMPIVQSIITCLNARHFRRTAMHDTARFGGQSGIWIEGPAGIGKTELIRATLSALGYSEGTDYWVFSASMDSKTMMLKLSEAFNRGLIVVIDELDTALNMEMIAEINSFLMGENLNYERPHAPGFTLMATGNGPGYAGRMALPASLKSRLHCHELGQYPEQEARYILYKQFQQSLSVRPDFAWTMEGHLKYHLAHPAHFTFRELCDWLVDGGNPNLPKCAPKPFVPQAPATAATQTHAYRSAAANMQTHQQPTLPSVNLPNFMN